MSKYNRASVPKSSKRYMNQEKPGPVPTHSSKLTTIMLVTVVALASAVAGFAFWKITELSRQTELQSLIVLPEAREIPAFSLVDQDGQSFQHEHMTGTWSLLFFGFTHCPDICPGTLYDLQLLKNAVDEEASDIPHQVIFFSVDPERDTPERLKEYVTYFDPDFLAVTGAHEQLLPLTRKLGIAYRIEEHDDGQAAYNVDHSASVLLINPEGRLHGVFPAPHDAAAMTADFLALVD